MLVKMCRTWFPDVEISFVYISEAHATDVWPIGKSAGVSNKRHITIEDRSMCAQQFIKEYDFDIPTYLDNMDDTLRDELAAWPFRFYLLKYSEMVDAYIFEYVAMPADAEFDFSILFDILKK